MSADTALVDLTETVANLDWRMANHNPDGPLNPYSVIVRSGELNRETTPLAERIAREGRLFGIKVIVDAPDDLLASYGDSDILRDYSVQMRRAFVEDYASRRDR
jgi:hypothetical protein